MANKFRVGDIVRGKENSGYTIANEEMIQGQVIKILNPKEDGPLSCFGDIKIKILEHTNPIFVGGEHTVNSKYFDLVKRNNSAIVIYQKGNEVIALDKSTGKKATAKCSLEDEFNFSTGAKIAFNRLMAEPQLLNTRICITRRTGPYNLTVGKIYEIKDGRFQDDDGTRFPIDDPITDIEDLKRYFSGEPCRTNGRRGCYAKTEFVEIVD